MDIKTQIMLQADSYANGLNIETGNQTWKRRLRSAAWDGFKVGANWGYEYRNKVNALPEAGMLELCETYVNSNPDISQLDIFCAGHQLASQQNSLLREENKRLRRMIEDELKRSMRLNMPGISPQEQEETWQRYAKLNNL